MTRQPLLGRSYLGPSLRLTLVAIVLLLAASGVGSAIAAQNLPAYTARPAQAGIDGRSSVLFRHSIESGSMVVDGVDILNLANDPAEFDVYVVDMVPSANGGLTAAARSAPVEGAGTWFAVSVDTVEIPSRRSAVVDFTMHVPEGTPPGDYTAVVMVETHESFGEGTISTRTRIGLPAHITVLADVNLDVMLGTITTRHTDQGIEIVLPVTNTGDVTFSTSGYATVDSWFGDETVVSQLSPHGAFIAPGEQIHLRALWVDPPRIGRYDVTVTIEASVGNRQPVPFTSDAATLWLIPWSTIITILTIAAIVAWVIRATRTTREERSKRKQEERDLIRDFRKQRDTAGA